uniref:WAT1-related protein n=1 Tax=Leersia perrieri TaxID=77586 RepID=A0A0D9VBA3_9ORYZ
MGETAAASGGARLHVAMLTLQLGYAGFHVVSRLALDMGVSKLVFPVYRNLIALFLLAPFAYFLEKKERPAMTARLAAQFFFLALCGITANQGFYLLGLQHTSPTFASAIQNSVPAITFAMAAALRIEPLNLSSRHGLAKLSGTLLSVAGASLITLFKGPQIHTLSSSTAAVAGEGNNNNSNWGMGCVYLMGHCVAWSGWLVMQAPVLRRYPARLTVTSYTCLFGLLQFLAIAAFAERDAAAWAVSSRSELLAVLYAGFVASGVAFAVQTWCIHRGGPVFVAVIIGAVLIVAGLYLVLWGKSQERAEASAAAAIADQQQQPSASAAAAADDDDSCLKQPLLLPTSTAGSENV